MRGRVISFSEMHYQKQKKKRTGRSRLKKWLPFANQQQRLGYENSISHGNIHDEKNWCKAKCVKSLRMGQNVPEV